MRIFAFVFARGGSKGLPGKNIKELNGKPLLEYSIDTANKIPEIEKIFVSTDDADIARVAKKNGATIIYRPKELAEDHTPEWQAWRHAIQWCLEQYGEFDIFLSLPATSPLRSKEDVQETINKLSSTKADICIGITPAGRNPYFNMVKISEDGFCRLVNEPYKEVTRRQDTPEVFDITTVVYATNPKFVMNSYGIFSGKVASVVIPKERAVDIDDIYDFKLAEFIMLQSKEDYA
ncbi:acylneuraminate cytidylyltransferase family protein [Stutzerimonas nitrititolerans]|uniref:acylneuraminate cytidylyltransferase family protein n=1 Tax=Stutzerimonas nitrititolerans TaxID=2482751 RepID=UPI0028ACA6D6|nr:acylneuraminate cytidylyltransferase family protein [Stutzerimonas nitrititolerans]